MLISAVFREEKLPGLKVPGQVRPKAALSLSGNFQKPGARGGSTRIGASYAHLSVCTSSSGEEEADEAGEVLRLLPVALNSDCLVSHDHHRFLTARVATSISGRCTVNDSGNEEDNVNYLG